MNKYLLSILILFSFFTAFSASAQIRDTDISISINPPYPTSNQSVKATLKSQAVDLNKAFITWSLNGQEQHKGIGKVDFQFNVGSLGSLMNVSALIDISNTGNVIKTISVRPAEVDLLWEAVDSYTPPFYKGKALASSQGAIKVVAIPSFASQSGTKNLSYVWNKDGKSQPQFSGWGKNFMTFQNSYLETQNEVSVKASDLLGSATASGSINLQTGNPKILFYKIDPVLGIQWNKALQNGFFVGEEGETFIAEPYFFSFKDINSPSIVLDWTLNGQKVIPPDSKNILSVRLESGEHGTALLKTTIENSDTLFQTAVRELRVSF